MPLFPLPHPPPSGQGGDGKKAQPAAESRRQRSAAQRVPSPVPPACPVLGEAPGWPMWGAGGVHYLCPGEAEGEGGAVTILACV